MRSDWRECLDDSIMSMRAGRMKRRTFMERAIALGLSTFAAGSLLEACGSITTHCTPQGWASKPNYIVWKSEHDEQEIYSSIVSDFQNSHPEVHVIYANSPFMQNKQYQDTINALQTCNAEMDVISIDVIWLPEFADKQLILPLPNQVASDVRNKYNSISGILESCTYKGQIYSAPVRVDIGVLYYNKKLVQTAPTR